jgi:RNA polymerase sigma factor (sigma-70 family)
VIEDYYNWTLEKCRDRIKTYQTNKDEYTRDLLLAKFDKYLVHIIHELRKKYSYLRDEEMQGLYHTAVLGFYKALDVFDCSLPPQMIFFVIRSYVRNELDIFFAYKNKEYLCPDLLALFEELNLGYKFGELEEFYSRLSAKFLMEHPLLKPMERVFLDGMYCQGMSRKELAKHFGYSDANVALLLKQALKKIRRILVRSGELTRKKGSR